MSVERSNLWNNNKMYQTSENPQKYYDTGEVVNSKIRKFFFLLQDKQIERDLRVTISVNTGDRIGDQNMLVELTNDVNPVFLFSLSITEADFDVLKNDQGLNVEFDRFPQALVNLLDQCKESVSENGGRFKLMLVDYCGTAAGCCIMDMNKIQIKIIEECPFKNICHLTLDIMRGTEIQIRQKLEAEVCMIKQSLLKTSKSHDEALMKVSDLVEQVNEKNNIIEKSNIVINELMVQKEEECSKLRSQAESQEKAIREEYNEKIAEERKQFEKRSCQMQTKIENLEKELRLFHEKELEMQNLLHEKERDKELIEVELVSKRQEINQLRTQNEKLDCDYHDKDKTVNILRTRLAVAEQELKDNNFLLLNHQNKLDEAIQEKINFQTNLEFLQNKLDKKETTIKNLSDEIIKANDIIAKQQSKLTISSSKLNECELTCLKLTESLKTKEDDLCKQNKVLNKLQEDLTISVKESNDLREKTDCFEKKLSALNVNLRNKSQIIATLRGNFESIIAEFQLNAPQRSLLSYRTYLSMPTLLPSDNHRHTDDLWDFILQDNAISNNLTSIDSYQESLKLSRLIRPYIMRYLKRFQSIPLSLFKSLDTPLTVLIAPSGFQSPQGRHLHKTQSQENINHVTEYAVYNKAIEHYLPSVHSDSSLSKSKDILQNNHNCTDYNKTKNVACDRTNKFKYVKTKNIHRLSGNDEFDDDKNFGLGKGNSNPPHYAPVGAFRLRPTERFQRMTEPAMNNNDQQYVKGRCKGSNFRRTPAVSAPPLTPEQRHAVDSVFKAGRVRHATSPIQANWDVPQNSYLLSSALQKSNNKSDLLYTAAKLSGLTNVHEDSQVKNLKSVTDMMTDEKTDRSIPMSKIVLDETESLPNIRRNGVSIPKPFLRSFDRSEHISAVSDVFDVSVDLPEPSAYFAI